MKSSHLAALCCAALTGGLIGAGDIQQQTSPGINHLFNAKVIQKEHEPAINPFAMMPSWVGVDYCAASWRKKNQRQIRLARRRKHAAGFKKAFA